MSVISHPRRPAEELYDLKKDPNQLENVAADAEYARGSPLWPGLEGKE